QLGGDVVVGDRAGLGLADRQAAGAVGRVRLLVTGRARLGHRIRAGVDLDVGAGGVGAVEARRVGPWVVNRDGEVAWFGSAAVIVRHLLDNRQRPGVELVADGAFRDRARLDLEVHAAGIHAVGRSVGGAADRLQRERRADRPLQERVVRATLEV